jgi:hypothetical protein
MLQPNEIHVGPADIYMDVDAPATAVVEGGEPTWMPHLNGVPSSGVHVGATLGESTFTWVSEKTDILAEQVMGILDKFISQQNATLAFVAEERNYSLMKHTFDNIMSVNNATRLGFTGGGGGSIIAPLYTTIFLSSARRDIAGAYEILVAYKCISINAMPLTYSRTAPSTYAVMFQCLPDTTRTRGDQIFQLSREKAAATFGVSSPSPSASSSATQSPSGSQSPSASVSPSA